MGEAEDQVNDVNMNSSEVAFDNLTILKELSNIVNLVKGDDFLETVPKAKIRRVKWVPMFDCLKQGIYDEMVQELNSLWDFEKMPQKLEILEKQKERFSEINPDKKAWRPYYSDVKKQLVASSVANLHKQKTLLEGLAKEYEGRVSKLKKTVTARRGYLKALQMDIQKYQKKNEIIFTKITERINNHEKLVALIEPNNIDIDNINWSEKKMDIKN